MTNLKRILATTDYSLLSNGVIRRIVWRAAREGSELLIVHTMPRPSTFTATEAKLAALVQTTTAVSTQNVRAEIADNLRPDRVVIGAHKAVGGTTSRILAHVACPVLVVRRKPVVDCRQSLAAVSLGLLSEAVL